MTHLLLIFDEPEAMIAVARRLRASGVVGLDAHVPYHIPALDEALDLPGSPVRLVMLLAAVVIGAGIWALQWWTAVHFYPFNSGGRPQNSWQIFTFAIFEFGILAAALAGFIAMFISCRLPRLHHPFFAPVETEGASDDLFYLCLAEDDSTPERSALAAFPGVREIIEVPP